MITSIVLVFVRSGREGELQLETVVGPEDIVVSE
jgi:hypothetical protein